MSASLTAGLFWVLYFILRLSFAPLRDSLICFSLCLSGFFSGEEATLCVIFIVSRILCLFKLHLRPSEKEVELRFRRWEFEFEQILYISLGGNADVFVSPCLFFLFVLTVLLLHIADCIIIIIVLELPLPACSLMTKFTCHLTFEFLQGQTGSQISLIP